MGIVDEEKLKQLMEENGWTIESGHTDGVYSVSRPNVGNYPGSFFDSVNLEDDAPKELVEQATEYLTPESLANYFYGPYQELKVNPGNQDAKDAIESFRDQAKSSGDLTARQIKAAEERAKKETGYGKS